MNKHYSNSISARLNRILNAWDEKKHPRDSKGRFTYVLKLSNLVGINKRTGGTGITSEAYDKLYYRMRDDAKGNEDKRWDLQVESYANDKYQNHGYKEINTALRDGESLEEAGAKELDQSCRFSFDEPITVHRGESGFSNWWSDVKVGDPIPEDMHNSIISTSVDRNVADHFATQKRFMDPKGKSKLYETNITMVIPPTQRVGIPSAFTSNIPLHWESEIILPWHTQGKVTKIERKEEKIDNRTVVKQEIYVTIG